MKFVRITDRRAIDVVAALSDEVVSAVEEEALMAAEVAEIDRLIEEVDRELAAARRAQVVAVSRDFTDQRRARRASRRADREVLRLFPSRARVVSLGEAA